MGSLGDLKFKMILYRIIYLVIVLPSYPERYVLLLAPYHGRENSDRERQVAKP